VRWFKTVWRDAGLARFTLRWDIERRHILDQAVLLEEGGEALVAPAVERGRRIGEARDGIAPGAPVELGVEILAALDEEPPALVGMVDEVERAALDRVDEAAQLRIGRAVARGHEDQLVEGRHAMFLDVEAPAGPAFQRHLVELEIAIGADHRVDLARHQRRRQREIDVGQRHVLEAEAGGLEHRADDGLVGARDRIADPLALEVGNCPDRTVGEHGDAVERRRDQGGDTHDRQAAGDLQMQLRLIGDGDVALAGGDEFRRIVGIGGRDQLDVEPRVFEIAVLERDIERPVIRIDEPVEQDSELVGGLGARREREGGQHGDGETEAHGSSPQGRSGSSVGLDSACQRVSRRTAPSTA
jgi:hypothetical protein